MTEQAAYKSGYKYQLAVPLAHVFLTQPPDPHTHIPSVEHLYFSIRPSQGFGVITLARWYASDGPSGPTIDTKNFMFGSFVHDALYQAIRLGFLDNDPWRRYADQELYALIRRDGMSWLRANWVYYALRWAGRRATLPSSERPVKVAP